jgi:release factor glutamine methyltransferase
LTVAEALTEGRRRLSTAGITESSLESELLLRHVLGAGIVDIYLGYNTRLSPENERAYFTLIDSRVAGEPTAYLTGQRDFYGLSFYVNPSVLIPRPETELLVERALEVAGGLNKPVIADVGTGSGVLAVVLAKRLPDAEIIATDISSPALETAIRNAVHYGVEKRITFSQGDLLAPFTYPVDIIVANLPYVNTGELPGTCEPAAALDGGINGLEIIYRLIQEAPSKLKPGGSILLEIGQGQARVVSVLLDEAFQDATIQTYCDLAGIERVTIATSKKSLSYPGPSCRPVCRDG